MLKQYCKEKMILIDKALKELLPEESGLSQTIFHAMRYSLFAGGKRLRPILLMASVDAVGGKGTSYMNVACGMEMIHTYSLIHDDLPAMDNDDYRRGKLTNHKVFGDGTAVLAGDGLLTFAFEVMLLQKNVDSSILIKVINEIAHAAGAYGMVGGQTVDLEAEGKVIDANTLKFIHRKKTGALFKASIRAGAMLANASEKQLTLLTEYAEQFGLAFQITDDILDVIGTQEKIGKPVGSDVKNHKATYVSLYSLEDARRMAKEAVDSALKALNTFGSEADVLRQMAESLLARDN